MNVKYHQIMDDDTIRSLLVKHRKSKAEAAKLLQVPYKCLENRAKKVLSVAEYERIKPERRRYSLAFKRAAVKAALKKDGSIKRSAEDNKIHPELLRVWARQFEAGVLSYKKHKKPANEVEARISE